MQYTLCIPWLHASIHKFELCAKHVSTSVVPFSLTNAESWSTSSHSIILWSGKCEIFRFFVVVEQVSVLQDVWNMECPSLVNVLVSSQRLDSAACWLPNIVVVLVLSISLHVWAGLANPPTCSTDTNSRTSTNVQIQEKAVAIAFFKVMRQSPWPVTSVAFCSHSGWFSHISWCQTAYYCLFGATTKSRWCDCKLLLRYVWSRGSGLWGSLLTPCFLPVMMRTVKFVTCFWKEKARRCLTVQTSSNMPGNEGEMKWGLLPHWCVIPSVSLTKNWLIAKT